MSYIVTPDLGLELADPNTIQAFETTNVNSNFLLLEAGIMADRADIVAAEAAITTIEGWDVGRAGSNGYAPLLFASLATLDAFSGAVVGDRATIVSPGTGISPIDLIATSGSGATIEWTIVGTVVAATKANLDSFISAVGVLSGTDVLFQVGGRAAALDTGVTYTFTSTAGVYRTVGGLVPIRPTSVAGTGVTLATDGTVTFSGSSPGTLSVNGCFTGDFKNYLIKFEQISASASVLGSFRLRAGGSDQASSVYDLVALYGQNNAAGSSTTTAQSSAVLYSGILVSMDVNVDRPQLNTYTLARIAEGVTPNPGTAATMISQQLTMLHRNSYQADGFSFVLANSVSGIVININIFGYGGPA
jgi:hypothetical protein